MRARVSGLAGKATSTLARELDLSMMSLKVVTAAWPPSVSSWPSRAPPAPPPAPAAVGLASVTTRSFSCPRISSEWKHSAGADSSHPAAFTQRRLAGTRPHRPVSQQFIPLLLGDKERARRAPGCVARCLSFQGGCTEAGRGGLPGLGGRGEGLRVPAAGVRRGPTEERGPEGPSTGLRAESS